MFSYALWILVIKKNANFHNTSSVRQKHFDAPVTKLKIKIYLLLNKGWHVMYWLGFTTSFGIPLKCIFKLWI